METKQIPADCTLARYRKEFASWQLYRQLRGCLVYQIIAVTLLLVIPLIAESEWPLRLFLVCGLLLISAIVAIGTRSKPWAIVATVIAVLWEGYILWYVCWWLIEDMWSLFQSFGFDAFLWSTRKEYTIVNLIGLLSGGMGILCGVKMLNVFKRIDAEYKELMANLNA